MNGEMIMLVVTVVVGLSLFFMVVSKKGKPITAIYLWFVQLLVVLGINIFMLNHGFIDTFTSTFGLLTILMLVLVLAIKRTKQG
jgi:hypothetical protein